MITNSVSHCALCVVISVAAVAALPQAPASADRFEVASVKPYKGPVTMISSNVEPSGRFVAQQQSLRDLITMAYKVRDSQIVGGPSWLGTDRFDVNAKASGELPLMNPTGEPGPLERMLQSLLADRFKLVAHREMREMPIFALVMARGDRKPGSRLRPATIDCATKFAEQARAGQAGPVMAGGTPSCGMVVSPWSIRMGGSPLSQLTMVLTQMTNRFVVDQTGLTGNYDVDLQWTPAGAFGVRRGAGGPPGGDGAPGGPPIPVPSPDANGATLEAAIQEQLGLKLDPQRAPVPVLVIDRAEPPTPD
jgi:uncharacterized protein (TIGR03435 family)